MPYRITDSTHPIGHFITALGAFFSPVAFLLLLVGIAIFFDTMTGRWCAHKMALQNGEDPRLAVTSKKTRKATGRKMLFYFGIVMSVYIMDIEIFNSFVLFWLKEPVFTFLTTKVAVIFLLWWEFDSIDEKYYKVHGVKIKDKMKQFADGIKSFIVGLVSLKSDLKKKDDEKNNVE